MFRSNFSNKKLKQTSLPISSNNYQNNLSFNLKHRISGIQERLQSKPLLSKGFF